MSVILDFSIFPVDKPDPSMSPYVARVMDIIEASGLTYELGAMGTIIEGEWEEVMRVIDACYRELDTDCDRIYFTIKGDCRKGRTEGITKKISSVQEKTTKKQHPIKKA